MPPTKFDARQTICYEVLTQIAKVTKTELDDLLVSIDTEVTPPLRLDASEPANYVVTVYSGTVVSNTLTGRQKSAPMIKSILPKYDAGETITFPSTSGGTVVFSNGNNVVLNVSNNNYIKGLVYLDSFSKMNIFFGDEDVDLDVATVPPPPNNILIVGYIELFNNNGTIDPISQENIKQFGSGSGSGTGFGNASKYSEMLREFWGNSWYEWMTPMVFNYESLDKEYATENTNVYITSYGYHFEEAGKELILQDFVTPEAISGGVSKGKYTIAAIWDKDYIDDQAEIKMSLTGEGTYEVVPMEQLEGTNLFRGEIEFDVPTAHVEIASFNPESYNPTNSFGQSFFTKNNCATSGNRAAVGSPLAQDGSGNTRGAVYIYQYDGTNWVFEQKLLPSSTNQGFGESVAMYNNLLAVGSNWNNTVYVFEYNGSTWIEKQILSPSISSGSFGCSVDIFNDLIVIGALTQDGIDNNGLFNSGAAYVFRHDGFSWVEEQIIASSNEEANARFGHECKIIDSLTLLVSSPYQNVGGTNDVGQVSIFKYSGGVWSETGQLFGENIVGRHFGWNIDSSGSTVVIGSGQNSGSKVFIYEFDGVDFTESQIIPIEAGSLTLSGNTLVMGKTTEDPSGIIYIYNLSGGLWVPKQSIIHDNAETGDKFGMSVGIVNNSNTTFVFGIGSNIDDGSGNDVGAIIGFEEQEVVAENDIFLKVTSSKGNVRLGALGVLYGDQYGVMYEKPDNSIIDQVSMDSLPTTNDHQIIEVNAIEDINLNKNFTNCIFYINTNNSTVDFNLFLGTFTNCQFFADNSKMTISGTAILNSCTIQTRDELTLKSWSSITDCDIRCRVLKQELVSPETISNSTILVTESYELITDSSPLTLENVDFEVLSGTLNVDELSTTEAKLILVGSKARVNDLQFGSGTINGWIELQTSYLLVRLISGDISARSNLIRTTNGGFVKVGYLSDNTSVIDGESHTIVDTDFSHANGKLAIYDVITITSQAEQDLLTDVKNKTIIVDSVSNINMTANFTGCQIHSAQSNITFTSGVLSRCKITGVSGIILDGTSDITNCTIEGADYLSIISFTKFDTNTVNGGSLRHHLSANASISNSSFNIIGMSCYDQPTLYRLSLNNCAVYSKSLNLAGQSDAIQILFQFGNYNFGGLHVTGNGGYASISHGYVHIGRVYEVVNDYHSIRTLLDGVVHVGHMEMDNSVIDDIFHRANEVNVTHKNGVDITPPTTTLITSQQEIDDHLPTDNVNETFIIEAIEQITLTSNFKNCKFYINTNNNLNRLTISSGTYENCEFFADSDQDLIRIGIDDTTGDAIFRNCHFKMQRGVELVNWNSALGSFTGCTFDINDLYQKLEADRTIAYSKLSVREKYNVSTNSSTLTLSGCEFSVYGASMYADYWDSGQAIIIYDHCNVFISEILFGNNITSGWLDFDESSGTIGNIDGASIGSLSNLIRTVNNSMLSVGYVTDTTDIIDGVTHTVYDGWIRHIGGEQKTDGGAIVITSQAEQDALVSPVENSIVVVDGTSNINLTKDFSNCSIYNKGTGHLIIVSGTYIGCTFINSSDSYFLKIDGTADINNCKFRVRNYVFLSAWASLLYTSFEGGTLNVLLSAPSTASYCTFDNSGLILMNTTKDLTISESVGTFRQIYNLKTDLSEVALIISNNSNISTARFEGDASALGIVQTASDGVLDIGIIGTDISALSDLLKSTNGVNPGLIHVGMFSAATSVLDNISHDANETDITHYDSVDYTSGGGGGGGIIITSQVEQDALVSPVENKRIYISADVNLTKTFVGCTISSNSNLTLTTGTFTSSVINTTVTLSIDTTGDIVSSKMQARNINILKCGTCQYNFFTSSFFGNKTSTPTNVQLSSITCYKVLLFNGIDVLTLQDCTMHCSWLSLENTSATSALKLTGTSVVVGTIRSLASAECYLDINSSSRVSCADLEIESTVGANTIRTSGGSTLTVDYISELATATAIDNVVHAVGEIRVLHYDGADITKSNKYMGSYIVNNSTDLAALPSTVENSLVQVSYSGYTLTQDFVNCIIFLEGGGTFDGASSMNNCILRAQGNISLKTTGAINRCDLLFGNDLIYYRSGSIQYTNITCGAFAQSMTVQYVDVTWQHVNLQVNQYWVVQSFNSRSIIFNYGSVKVAEYLQISSTSDYEFAYFQKAIVDMSAFKLQGTSQSSTYTRLRANSFMRIGQIVDSTAMQLSTDNIRSDNTGSDNCIVTAEYCGSDTKTLDGIQHYAGESGIIHRGAVNLLKQSPNWISRVKDITALDVDWNLGAYQHKTISADSVFTFSNDADGMQVTLAITADGTNRNVTFPTAKWESGTAPTAVAAATTTLVSFVKINGILYGSAIEGMTG